MIFRPEMADDAMYWLGDIAYGERQYEKALGYFEQMLAAYPAAEFAPAALFKSHTCL